MSLVKIVQAVKKIKLLFLGDDNDGCTTDHSETCNPMDELVKALSSELELAGRGLEQFKLNKRKEIHWDTLAHQLGVHGLANERNDLIKKVNPNGKMVSDGLKSSSIKPPRLKN
jgi:hypothetical protein